MQEPGPGKPRLRYIWGIGFAGCFEFPVAMEGPVGNWAMI